MNKIFIMGRLTRDPELTTTQSGVEKSRYTVAVDEPKDKNGEKKVNFFNCVAFKSGAVFVSKYFKKGDGIIVIGRMDSYKGNDEKTYWNIIAESHDFPLGRSSGSAQAPAPAVDAASGMEVVVNTEEVPF